jgi:hypothetical protein
MQTILKKRGDTISLAGTVTLPAGGNWHGISEVRTPDRVLVGSFVVTVTPPVAPATAYSVLVEAASTETAGWPVGGLLCDVRFIDDSTPPVVRTFPDFLIQLAAEQSDV